MVTYFTNYIRASIKSGAPAARESWDHAFRPIRRNEYIELRHAATVATGLWLFIFKPNDLLADNNELIVSTL